MLSFDISDRQINIVKGDNSSNKIRIENSGQNTEGTGDVVFKVAKNGYYLYVYLVFSNGGIACYQYDCIDM